MASPSPVSARSDWWWIFDPRQSLRARAALLVGAGALVFSTLVVVFAVRQTRATLTARAGAEFEGLAFQVSDKLDRTLYERYRTLTFAATLASMRDRIAAPEDRRRLLESLQDATPDFAWIGLIDPTGNVVSATGGRFENTSVATRPWFRGAQENAFAGSGTSPETDPTARILDLAVPVRDAEGRFAGVLAAQVRWTWSREVQLSVIPETLTRQQIGVTVYAESDVLLDSGASGWSLPPPPPELPDPRRARGHFIEYVADGSRYLSGFARSRGFREYRGLGWLAVVRQPATATVEAVSGLQRKLTLWAVALSVGAAALAWLAASAHARRLRSMRAAAERIHEGDILAVLPRPSGESELARMCRSVGDLVEDLRGQPNAPPPSRKER
jgi:HAMP domain-containing protein